MANVNDFKFWEDIYLNNDTGWDLGGPTPVFIEISKQITPVKLIILGCGRGYDAIMLAK
jgi:Thiopurine S-methyltransferase (TPMT).